MTTETYATHAAVRLPAGYSARPPAMDDLTAVVAMLNRDTQALLGVNFHSAEDWATDWKAPSFHLADNAHVVLAPDGQPAGYAHVWDAPPHVQLEQFGCVDPGHTRRGLGSYLLAWLEQRAHELMRAAPPLARISVTDWVNSLDTATQHLLRAHGHQHVRTNWRMIIDLDSPDALAAPEWPAGVGVRNYVPGQDERAALSVIRSAFRDHWGAVERPFEEDLAHWKERWGNDPHFDPSLWYLAVAGEEVIGTALSRLAIPEDPEMGFIFSLGVLRAWRRQGIAGALLRQCFAGLRERGQRRAGLGVDAGSLTNAVRLYEKAGMRSDPRQSYEIWEKELRPGVEWSTTELQENEPYTCRPARPEDVPGVHQLLRAIAAVQPNNYSQTLADVARLFADPWANPETDARVAVTAEGAIVAYAHLIANPEPAEAVRAYLEEDIHPAHRSRGLEEPLLDWLEARAAERLREIAAEQPVQKLLSMHLSCWDTEHDWIARYQRHGFDPARHSYRMRRDLSQPLPERPLPAGLTLCHYQPEIDERIRQAFNEAFRDGRGFEPYSALDWQLFFVQYSAFRPDLSFAILDGDEVAAFSMNRFDADEAERTGFKAGWIGSLGTRRAWRKRGLASALLVASMRAFQAAGLEYAGLGVDTENPTGALRLYESLGFAPYVRSIQFQKTL